MPFPQSLKKRKNTDLYIYKSGIDVQKVIGFWDTSFFSAPSPFLMKYKNSLTNTKCINATVDTRLLKAMLYVLHSNIHSAKIQLWIPAAHVTMHTAGCKCIRTPPDLSFTSFICSPAWKPLRGRISIFERVISAIETNV